uniref:Uncharacterized protein n=1 Tax=Mucochytrium quahogii TaxID=96639 RepID=A0A7S2RCR7_9STRA|mmetsp:Transcript_37711/g.61389  ORF Transcript_37711/g.61389 Transcript_37711/m.61389 type:complete len:421 (+) Transcript_37711:439-1701(+)|eukprot:CAMPEP_0203750710 /NCGR_PEP_ID=MMETSP0098-20131031/4904_1 /ASSEMBLY_ACC=CAM_ASM_000208 /TAXON_ID=96639 /ORGANISM=" , Strain NY0313808BC1" /LENGTH=420 /DNA_ID=CAMNT_0050640127 /DNA_START=387 /DNA_END=1649 /DNA_ORIENTATION=+
MTVVEKAQNLHSVKGKYDEDELGLSVDVETKRSDDVQSEDSNDEVVMRESKGGESPNNLGENIDVEQLVFESKGGDSPLMGEIIDGFESKFNEDLSYSDMLDWEEKENSSWMSKEVVDDKKYMDQFQEITAEEFTKLLVRSKLTEGELSQTQSQLAEVMMERDRALMRLEQQERMEKMLYGHQMRLEEMLINQREPTPIDTKNSKLQLDVHDAEMKQCKEKIVAKDKRIRELERELDIAQKIGVDAREEYEKAIHELRDEMHKALMTRQSDERLRRSQLEKQLDESRHALQKETDAHKETTKQIITFENRARAAQICSQRVPLLERENKELQEKLHALDMELAQIKIDLATRRSDEDDLIARLEVYQAMQEQEDTLDSRQIQTTPSQRLPPRPSASHSSEKPDTWSPTSWIRRAISSEVV